MSDDSYELMSPENDSDSGSEKIELDAQALAQARKKLCDRWFKKIDKAKDNLSTYREDAKRACKTYNMREDDGSTTTATTYPLLWSNVQVIRGSLYTATPAPDVRRRDGRNEPLFRAAAMMIERGLTYLIDQQDFDGQINRSITDNLVPGLAQLRVNYDADVDYVPLTDPTTGEPLFDDLGQPLQQPKIENEVAFIEHVAWDRFLYDPCVRWEECQWVDFIHFLDRHDMIEQFDYDPKESMVGATQSAIKEGRQKYEVHEVWCKRKKQVLFLMRGKDEPLRVSKDMMNLKNFFPCPKPWLANTMTDGFRPIPDYLYYEVQDRQINRLTSRIINLTATGTVARGFYDSGIGEDLSQLVTSDDLEYIPVNGLWNKLADAGGGGSLWDRVIADFPIRQAVEVIQVLQQQRESELQHVYQITGISDIMRGSSKASETAKAQAIKSAAASSRASIRKQAFDQFVSEAVQIMAEVAAEHFQPETWEAMTGIRFTPQMEDIIRNQTNREYAIGVQTDSTIAIDDQGNKEAAMEAVNVTTNMLGQLVPMMKQGLPGDLVQQMLMTAMRPFKETRNFEEAIQQIPSTSQQMDQMRQQMQQMAQQLQQAEKAAQQAQGQVDQYKLMEAETKRLAAVAEAQRDQSQGDRLEAQSVEDLSLAELNEARKLEILHGIRTGNTGAGRNG